MTSSTPRVSPYPTISHDNASSVTLVTAAEVSGVASPVQADEKELAVQEEPAPDRDLADISIYRYYFATAPSAAWLLVYGSLAVLVALHTFMCKLWTPLRRHSWLMWWCNAAVWVKWWAEDNDREPNHNLNMRVGVYWLLGALVAGFFVLTPWYAYLPHFGKGRTRSQYARCLWSLVAPRTMVALHRDLLQTVLKYAPRVVILACTQRASLTEPPQCAIFISLIFGRRGNVEPVRDLPLFKFMTLWLRLIRSLTMAQLQSGPRTH